jgi:hypothetical protein
MLVPAPQVRHTTVIAFQFKGRQLRNCYPKGVLDSVQPSRLSLLGSPGYLFEEVAAKWIISPTDGSIRFPDKLRNEVEIADALKERYKLAEVAIHIDLLEVCLPKSCGILQILRDWPPEYRLPLSSHDLPG